MTACVYLIQCVDYHKIGVSDDIVKRMIGMQTGNPYDIELLHSFEADRPKDAESLMHRIFKHKRAKGEWFLLADSDINFIRTIEKYMSGSFVFTEKPIPVINTDRKTVKHKTFTVVDNNGESITFTDRLVMDFVLVAWKRQINGDFPFSRRYWCQDHRPRVRTCVYQAIMGILSDSRLIVNRRQGASGQLLSGPEETMSIVLANFAEDEAQT